MWLTVLLNESNTLSKVSKQGTTHQNAFTEHFQ